MEGHEVPTAGIPCQKSGNGKKNWKTAICSFWTWLLSTVRARYPFKEDPVNSKESEPLHEGIQYLREVAVLEVIYTDLKSDSVPKDPEDVPYTVAMWRKVVPSAPASYSSIWVVLCYLQLDRPGVEVASSWL